MYADVDSCAGQASRQSVHSLLTTPCHFPLSPPPLPTHSGLVWDRVSAVSKACVDNKSCLFGALAKVVTVMNDTLREVGEVGWEDGLGGWCVVW